jgi:hypothetical protein
LWSVGSVFRCIYTCVSSLFRTLFVAQTKWRLIREWLVNGELKDVEESSSGPVWHEATNLPRRTEETYEYKQKR